MIMSFYCSCRNKIGAELHIYLEEGTYHKRLFRGPNTNDMREFRIGGSQGSLSHDTRRGRQSST